MSSKPKLKTRIAPTPSGFLHEGNAFSFVLTALIAHLAEADILLRIDDLDRARYRKKYADDIFRILHFLGIEWQEGPNSTSELESSWSQHERMEIYKAYLRKLEEKDAVFACDCSRKKVLQDSEDGGYPGTCRQKSQTGKRKTAMRLKTDPRSLVLKQWPKRQTQDYLPDVMRNFVVRRKDQVPAYQLASVADDLHFGVNLIVRGSDLYDSSLAQLFIADVLEEKGFLNSSFFHHPLISRQGGDKLSKSAGDGSSSPLRAMKSQDFYRLLSRWMMLQEEVQNLDELKVYAKEYGFPGHLHQLA